MDTSKRIGSKQVEQDEATDKFQIRITSGREQVSDAGAKRKNGQKKVQGRHFQAFECAECDQPEWQDNDARDHFDLKDLLGKNQISQKRRPVKAPEPRATVYRGSYDCGIQAFKGVIGGRLHEVLLGCATSRA